MFQGFSPATIDFMWGIRLNNYRSWFEAHKEEYKRDLLNPMKELGGEVYDRLGALCEKRDFILKVARIYRDARRIRGGPPYSDHLWLTIEKPAGERLTVPAFWFELTPDEWSYGLGYYSARPVTMAKFRKRLDTETEKFERLIYPLSTQSEFVLEGPEYKRKKSAPSAETEPWYNRRYLQLSSTQPHSKELFSSALAGRIAAGFEFLMPFYDYFITLDSDPDPDA